MVDSVANDKESVVVVAALLDQSHTGAKGPGHCALGNARGVVNRKLHAFDEPALFVNTGLI